MVERMYKVLVLTLITVTVSQATDCEISLFKLKRELVDEQNHKKKPDSCAMFGYYDGVRKIHIGYGNSFYVLCDGETAGPGWLVIQRRKDGSEKFYNNWEDYRIGFGEFTGEFWLGLEKLYLLTNNEPHELHIQITPFHGDGDISFITYTNFVVGSESEMYRLKSVGSFSGTATDQMTAHVNHMFTTFDKDNDDWSHGNLAYRYHGGWWYRHDDIGTCNPNGKYYNHSAQGYLNSVHWEGYTSHKEVKMLIRPKKWHNKI